jgi:hypothetical protein
MEFIMLREINQTQKDKYNIFSHMYNSLFFKDIKIEERLLGIWKDKSERKRVIGVNMTKVHYMHV